MKIIDKKVFLLQHIKGLEIQQTTELYQLKRQFHSTVEQLNPLYFLKNTITSIISSPEVKSDMFNNAVNIASHFISKNTMLGAFQKPIKRILGNVLMTVLNKISPKKEL